jgi:hypothetical protein
MAPLSAHALAFVLVVALARLEASTAAAAVATTAQERSFVISGDQFLKDGQPFRVISGSFHYFRVHPSEWADRLQAMRACGLNAVQTYVAWNVHNPARGTFEWSGFANLTGFFELAQAAGLLVVLRPGPYICAEWDFGGFPSWILAEEPAMRVRTADPRFLQFVSEWMQELLTVVAPYTYAAGGPVIMAQVENEYGSYGSDKEYLASLRDLYRSTLGPDIVLHSTDGYLVRMFEGSQLEGVFPTVDFGPGVDPAYAFSVQRQFTTGPLYNSEFYTGWLTHWGEPSMASTNTSVVAGALDQILALNASVNMYMFVGSTNFGFWNGANAENDADDYAPVVTSYDYDAPIAEGGALRDKYFAIQQVISKYLTAEERLALPPVPARSSVAPINVSVELKLAPFWEQLPTLAAWTTQSQTPLTLEELGQSFGFVLYRTQVAPPDATLTLQDVRDRAYVYLDQELVGVIQRSDAQGPSLSLSLSSQLTQLDVLVESQGRVNFGPWIDGFAGVTRGMRLGNQFVSNFSMLSLPLASVQSLQLQGLGTSCSSTGACFAAGSFDVPQGAAGAPLWLVPDGWTKGVAFVNGFNIGRYWQSRGPQYALYISPAILLPTDNDLVLLELEAVPSSLPCVVITTQGGPGRRA